MSLVQAIWRDVRDEHWASGIRIWVDAWRDMKAYRLKLSRTDPTSIHVAVVRRNREYERFQRLLMEANKPQDGPDLLSQLLGGNPYQNAANSSLNGLHMMQQNAVNMGLADGYSGLSNAAFNAALHPLR